MAAFPESGNSERPYSPVLNDRLNPQPLADIESSPSSDVAKKLLGREAGGLKYNRWPALRLTRSRIVSRRVWSYVIVGGVLWAAAYNSVWGIAWFAFMRQEWRQATATINQALPWTPQFWAFWIPLTALIGISIMAYLVSNPDRSRIIKRSMAAALTFWGPATVGMTAWAWYESLPTRTVLLDTGINLVAVVAAGLVGIPVLSTYAKDQEI